MNSRFLTPQKYLTPDEVQKLRKTLDESAKNALARQIKAPVRDSAILHTILGAGLRVSEVCKLTLGDVFINYGENELIIRDSKRGKSRSVKIGTDLKKKLKGFLKWKRKNGEPMVSDAHVFLSERKSSFTCRGVQKRFKIYLKKAGIEKDCGIHSLRHTFAVLLYKVSGNNLRMVQKQLGHSSVATTQVYADVMDEDTIEAVDKMFTIPEKKAPKKAWQLDSREARA